MLRHAVRTFTALFFWSNYASKYWKCVWQLGLKPLIFMQRCPWHYLHVAARIIQHLELGGQRWKAEPLESESTSAQNGGKKCSQWLRKPSKVNHNFFDQKYWSWTMLGFLGKLFFITLNTYPFTAQMFHSTSTWIGQKYGRRFEVRGRGRTTSEIGF